jgi:phytoene synthase
MNVAAAYEACEAITRREAKNFAYGIKLLRGPERQAMSAVYAMARRIDDIGDGDAAPADKLDGLARVRASLGRPGVRTEDPVLVALGDAATTYDLPLECFDELIDGCVQDVQGARYETMTELVGYCRLVAGSVGRLSVAILSGAPTDEMRAHADDLGVALQLTNILRDVVEDRERGRVYLPVDDSLALGCDPGLRDPKDVAQVVGFECAAAHVWFAKGLQLLPLLEYRGRACVSAMAGIYRRLLLRIERDPEAVTRGRVSLPTWEKALVAARSLAGATP